MTPTPLTRTWAAAQRHPVLVLVGASLFVRLVAAVALAGDELVPDEANYVDLAATVADGGEADDWMRSYGPALYRAVWPFIVPIRLVFEVAGPERFLAQLWAASWGVVTTVLTWVLAKELLPRRAALGAALVVALLPSQVVWSSIVLRESMIWTTLVGVAALFAVTIRAPWRWAAPALAGCAGLLLVLGFLRTQTLVVAAWSLVIAAVAVGGRGRLVRVGVTTVFALVVPALAGIGVGGVDLVRTASTSLDRTRTVLSVDADSGVGEGPLFRDADGDTVSCEPERTIGERTQSTAPGAVAIAGADRVELTGADGKRTEVVCGTDRRYHVVDDGAGATLRHLPKGVATNLFEPYPWSGASDGLERLASVENLAWYGIYVLALVGIAVSIRRPAAAYPIVVTGAILAASIVTQGNAGTAFRHRAEVLWSLAVFAVLGARRLVGSRRTT